MTLAGGAGINRVSLFCRTFTHELQPFDSPTDRRPAHLARRGSETAQRMALQLLERDRSGGTRLAQALSQAMEGVGHCRQCRTLTEDDLCPQCADTRRDDTLLCVVEGPMDVYAVEQTGFRGRYFVLKGHLSPLDGLGRKPSVFRS